MKTIITLLLVVLISYSCELKQKFNKTKWSEVDSFMNFPNRKYMIDDLMKNYPLTGKKFSYIIELLERPQGGDLDSTFEIFYNIDTDYGYDIDPVYAKTLIISFNRDSTANKVDIKEYKN